MIEKTLNFYSPGEKLPEGKVYCLIQFEDGWVSCAWYLPDTKCWDTGYGEVQYWAEIFKKV